MCVCGGGRWLLEVYMYIFCFTTWYANTGSTYPISKTNIGCTIPANPEHIKHKLGLCWLGFLSHAAFIQLGGWTAATFSLLPHNIIFSFVVLLWSPYRLAMLSQTAFDPISKSRGMTKKSQDNKWKILWISFAKYHCSLELKPQEHRCENISRTVYCEKQKVSKILAKYSSARLKAFKGSCQELNLEPSVYKK